MLWKHTGRLVLYISTHDCQHLCTAPSVCFCIHPKCCCLLLIYVLLIILDVCRIVWCWRRSIPALGINQNCVYWYQNPINSHTSWSISADTTQRDQCICEQRNNFLPSKLYWPCAYSGYMATYCKDMIYLSKKLFILMRLGKCIMNYVITLYKLYNHSV